MYSCMSACDNGDMRTHTHTRCLCAYIYIYTSVDLCIYMHRVSGSDVRVAPIVERASQIISQILSYI